MGREELLEMFECIYKNAAKALGYDNYEVVESCLCQLEEIYKNGCFLSLFAYEDEHFMLTCISSIRASLNEVYELPLELLLSRNCLSNEERLYDTLNAYYGYDEDNISFKLVERYLSDTVKCKGYGYFTKSFCAWFIREHLKISVDEITINYM